MRPPVVKVLSRRGGEREREKEGGNLPPLHCCLPPFRSAVI